MGDLFPLLPTNEGSPKSHPHHLSREIPGPPSEGHTQDINEIWDPKTLEIYGHFSVDFPEKNQVHGLWWVGVIKMIA